MTLTYGVRLSQKTRRGPDGEPLPGPIHIDRVDGLAWCGVRLPILSRSWEGVAEEASCRPCQIAHSTNRPRAWRR